MTFKTLKEYHDLQFVFLRIYIMRFEMILLIYKISKTINFKKSLKTYDYILD